MNLSFLDFAGAIALGAVCLYVGVRLLLVGRRTQMRAETLLGVMFLTSGVFGNFFLALGYTAPPALAPGFTGIATALFYVGTVCLVAFLRHVLYPGRQWARILEWILRAVCVVVFIGEARAGGFATPAPDGVWAWIGVVLHGGTFGWVSVDTALYRRRLARQLRLGLVEPIVVQRVFLWSVAAGAASLAAFSDAIGSLGNEFASLVYPIASVCGLVGALSIWAAFFPPRWIRGWMESRARSVRVEA